MLRASALLAAMFSLGGNICLGVRGEGKGGEGKVAEEHPEEPQKTAEELALEEGPLRRWIVAGLAALGTSAAAS